MTNHRRPNLSARIGCAAAVVVVTICACGERPIADPASATQRSGSPQSASPQSASAVGSLANDSATISYLAARHALDRGDSAAAIQNFERVFVQWPQSVRAPQAMYWKAFVLDRRGGAQNLQIAQNLLELATQIAPSAYAVGDAATLLLRVRARLAATGDRAALRALGMRDVAAFTACGDTGGASRLAWAVDAGASPSTQLDRLRTIMRTQTACAVAIREQALLLLARVPNGDGVADLLRAAREDRALVVRQSALRVLPRPAPDAARTLLEHLLASEQDLTSIESAAAAWASRPEWGTAPLEAYLRRTDRNATAADYVETLLRR